MTYPTNATEALAREISDMSRHKENDGPELEAALALHGLPHDRPSQLADAFRCGWDRRGDTISAIQEQNKALREALEWAEDELASYAPDPSCRSKVTEGVLVKVRTALAATKQDGGE